MGQEQVKGLLLISEGEDACAFVHRGRFMLGAKVRKIKGSQWHGVVVGFYTTELTPEGYAVESSTEKGSVQIYPAAALELDPEA